MQGGSSFAGVVHPDSPCTVILQPADSEIGDDRFHSWVHAQVPHDGTAVGVALCTDSVGIDFLLGQQVAEDSPLDGVPQVVLGLFGVGQLRPIWHSADDVFTPGFFHVPVAESGRIFGEMLAVTGFPTIVMCHDCPTFVDKSIVWRRCPHPTMHIHESRGILCVGIDCVFAVHTDFFTQVVGTNVALLSVDAVACFF